MGFLIGAIIFVTYMMFRLAFWLLGILISLFFYVVTACFGRPYWIYW